MIAGTKAQGAVEPRPRDPVPPAGAVSPSDGEVASAPTPTEDDACAQASADDLTMTALAAGSAEALRDLMARHADGVLAVAFRITRDRAVAEDLVQETFLRVFRNAGGYRPGRSARPWITTIARNLAIKHLRRRTTEADATSEIVAQAGRGGPGSGGADDPSARASRAELAARIEGALAQIEEPYRSALRRCAVEGLSYDAAAAACGCTVKTLSSRLARGRARFRALMEPYLREDRS